jgi:hypothetical protein
MSDEPDAFGATAVLIGIAAMLLAAIVFVAFGFAPDI